MPLDLTHRFPADPPEIGRARSLLRTWLDDTGVSGDDAFDIVLVFSELAANAVKAAVRSGERGEVAIDLTGRCDDVGCVVVEVAGPGEEFESSRVRPLLPSELAETGRGLAIVAALSDSVDAERRGSATAIRATKLVSTIQPRRLIPGQAVEGSGRPAGNLRQAERGPR